MSQQPLQAIGLPPIDQVGFVVRDIDAAIAQYEPLFGPFSRMETPIEGATYRGRKADCELKIAFGRSGNLEIELIECVSGEGPHREFIDAGGEGMHHLRFRVEDVDAWLPKLKKLGYEPVWSKRWSADTVFCYLQREDDPTLLELLQMP